jgi:ubiquinone biosynthesis protein UbiJ
VVVALRVDDTGLLQSHALADGAPDLRLAIPPWVVPGLLADPGRWSEAVTSQGDEALAGTLRELAETTPFWIEQLFSRWLGPVIGLRVAAAGRQMLAFPDQAAARIAENVGSYLRDQMGVLATGEEGRVFAEQTRALANRVDALATRLEAIAARVESRLR